MFYVKTNQCEHKEAEELMVAVTDSDLKLQIGHMKRFDLEFKVQSLLILRWERCWLLKAGIVNSTHRYPMTDAVQPLILKSDAQRQPMSKSTQSNIIC